MRKLTLLALALITTLFVMAQDKENPTDALKEKDKEKLLKEIQKKIDSVERSFTYQHGTIKLSNGIGEIVIPEGFKYLDPTQAERVLVDLWGNPKGNSATLGLILPENRGVLGDSGYVFNIEYDEIGYVKDNDADDINYNELLSQMQKDAVEENKERVKAGYESASIVGWAAKPFYDKDRKILHWAKEIRFGNEEVNTLNYNIRILGRKGVLVLNAIAPMTNLPLVQKDLPNVLTIVHFNDGYKYKDFDGSADKVAAWTIGGLVAGKLLAKAGFFVLLLKFWKIAALAIAGFFGAIWKWFKRKKNGNTIEEEETADTGGTDALPTPDAE